MEKIQMEKNPNNQEDAKENRVETNRSQVDEFFPSSWEDFDRQELYEVCLRIIRCSEKIIEAGLTEFTIFKEMLPPINMLIGRRKNTVEESKLLDESIRTLHQAAFEIRCGISDLIEIRKKINASNPNNQTTIQNDMCPIVVLDSNDIRIDEDLIETKPNENS